MSDANRIRVSVIAETSFGVIPTSPAWLVVPTTGHSMRDLIGYQQSATINNDRNVQDLVRLSKAAGGGLPMELTYSAASEGLNLLMTAAMAGTEAAAHTETGVTTTAGAKTITKGGATFVTDGYEVGDIVKTTVGLAADLGFFRLTAVAEETLTVAADANFTGDAGLSMEVTRGAKIKNGTTETTFSIEVAWLDLDKAQVFTGCAVDGMDFTIADGAITSVNFSFQAASSTLYDANNGTAGEYQTSSSHTDPATNPVLDSIGVPQVRSGGSAYAAKSVNMSLRNNVAPRTQIGSLGAQSMRFGEFGASGSIQAYHEDLTELTAYAANTTSNIWLVMEDANDKGWSLSFPEIKYGDAAADVTGSNTDVFVNLSVTAIKDPVELCTAKLQRWD